MAEFIWIPEYEADVTVEPRVLSATFGEGYAQETEDGINAQVRKVSLTFADRDMAEAAAIHAFLRLHHLAFDWTDPDGEPGRWKCPSWKRVWRPGNLRTVTATFEEVFGR